MRFRFAFSLLCVASAVFAFSAALHTVSPGLAHVTPPPDPWEVAHVTPPPDPWEMAHVTPPPDPWEIA